MRFLLSLIGSVATLGLKPGWCLSTHVKHWNVIPQSDNARKIVCRKCNTKFAMHDGLRTFFPINDSDEREMDEMYTLINTLRN